MGTESIFYYPIELHQGAGTGSIVAPVVSSLAREQYIQDVVVILAQTIASAVQGLQAFDGRTWRLTIPMPAISKALLQGASIAVYTNLVADVTVDASTTVYKNGQLSPVKVLEAGNSVYGVLIPPIGPTPPVPSDEQPDFYAYTALTDVSGHRVMRIAVGGVTYADSNNIFHANLLLGITRGAALAGAKVLVQIFGELTEPSWNWVPGMSIFCGVDGFLTQTMPTQGFVAVIAQASTPQTIIVNPKPPILVGP